MSIIEFRNVSKEYISGGETIRSLNNITFNIEEGSFTVILGPSGCGKSTTLNLMGGLEKPTSGQIMIEGRDISTYSKKELSVYRRNKVGFVFQFYNLIQNLSAYENVDIVRRLNKDSISTEEALKKVGVLHKKNCFPMQMSGGEMQRVSIARAICKHPKLLLCDEPTGALDSKTGKNIVNILQSMSQKHNMTVVMVTHNSLITPCADRIIYLSDGAVKKVVDNPHVKLVEEIEWE